MRDDVGPGTDEHEESFDGTWNGPSADETWGDDQTAEESEVMSHDWEEEDVANIDEDAADTDEEELGGNVAGDFGPSESIEPGTPDLGNALFVIFGAYLTVLAFARLFIGAEGFGGRDLLVLTGGTLLVSIVVLGFLGLLTPDT